MLEIDFFKFFNIKQFIYVYLAFVCSYLEYVFLPNIFKKNELKFYGV